MTVELAELIRERLKREAANHEELVKLSRENPRLAELCKDLDSIINSWAIREWKRMRNKEVVE